MRAVLAFLALISLLVAGWSFLSRARMESERIDIKHERAQSQVEKRPPSDRELAMYERRIGRTAKDWGVAILAPVSFATAASLLAIATKRKEGRRGVE